MGERYRIGDWEFDVDGAALIGAEGERRLEDRAARTLALLCRRRGETIGQAEILAEVWHGRAVSANSVAVVIGDLRRSLGDDAREPRFIATVAKRGYRLNPEPATVSVPAGRPPYRAAAAILLVALLLFGLFLWRAEQPRTILIEPVRNETGERRYAPLALALGELVTDRLSRRRGLALVRAGAGPPGDEAELRLSSRLILWNGQPTLSISAADPGSGAIVWTAMAPGPADALATHVIQVLERFPGGTARD